MLITSNRPKNLSNMTVGDRRKRKDHLNSNQVMEYKTMKLKIATGALVCLAMTSTTFAATCPTLSVTQSQSAEDLTFISARIKDGSSPKSVVICRYEGKGDIGASAGFRAGTPVKGTGSNWKGDDCAVTDGDAAKCAFK